MSHYHRADSFSRMQSCTDIHYLTLMKWDALCTFTLRQSQLVNFETCYRLRSDFLLIVEIISLYFYLCRFVWLLLVFLCRLFLKILILLCFTSVEKPKFKFAHSIFCQIDCSFFELSSLHLVACEWCALFIVFIFFVNYIL